MRVIAGSARRLLLKTPDGQNTRPTTDRTKETLFNMLTPDLYDGVFLDLFAGSGAIGIEALSRGVRKAVFVEQNPKAIRCIYENLQHTHLAERAEVQKGDVLDVLRRLDGREKYDFIFMDPPYGRGLEEIVLKYLRTSALLKEDSLIIVEAALETSFSYLEESGYVLYKEKKYKTNKHMFLRRLGKEGLC